MSSRNRSLPTENENESTDSSTTSPENETGLKSDTAPVAKPDVTKPIVPDAGDSIVQSETAEVTKPETPVDSLKWHSDYIAAYVEASQKKR